MVERKTKVFIEEFKGHKIFAIYEVDGLGDKKKSYSRTTGELVEDKVAISFGKGKAKDILNHLQELKIFVEGEQDL